MARRFFSLRVEAGAMKASSGKPRNKFCELRPDPFCRFINGKKVMPPLDSDLFRRRSR